MKENTLETKKEISHIHFLVHPGYMTRTHWDRKTNLDYPVLLQKYIAKAKTLKADEVMIVFAPAANEHFVSEVRNNSEIYVECLKQIKSILGDRAIVLSSQGEVEEDYAERIWKKILSTLNTRGFVLSRKLTAEAYGEYLNYCVSQVSSHMHKISGMDENSPVILRADLTEYSVPAQQDKTLRPAKERTKRDWGSIDLAS
jgi:hypothetical protein